MTDVRENNARLRAVVIVILRHRDGFSPSGERRLGSSYGDLEHALADLLPRPG